MAKATDETRTALISEVNEALAPFVADGAHLASTRNESHRYPSLGCTKGDSMIRSACVSVIAIVVFVLAAGIEQHPAAAQTSPTSGGSIDPALIEDLVAANRILAQEGILDAFGHVSLRHPSNRSRYLM